MIEPIYNPSGGRYNDMHYRRAGHSGVLLPEISLGLWQNFGGINDYSNSVAMAHYAFDNGITHFDLANNYGPPYGSAEATFGRMMNDSFRPYRDELFIATKAGYDMWPGPYGNWGSRKYLLSSLDQSLKRMNLDYVDVYYTHRYDPLTPIEETMQALVDVVKAGKALYVGISRYPHDVAQQCYDYLLQRDVRCLLYQGRYNLLDQAVEKEGILSQAGSNGVGTIVFSPLAQGLLTDRYLHGIPQNSRMAREHFLKSSTLTPQLLERLVSLNELAARRGQTLAQMALAWLLKDEQVTSVLVGASSVEQLQGNLMALKNTQFSDQELQQVESLVGTLP